METKKPKPGKEKTPKVPDSFEKKIEWTINIRNKTAVWGIAIAIILALTVHFIPTPPFSYTESLAVFGAVIGVTALIYNALNLNNNFTVNIAKIESDRKIASMNIITEWYKDFSEKSRALKECRERHALELQKVVLEKSAGQTSDEIQRLLRDIVETQKDTSNTLYKYSLIPILNYFEKISIGVLEKAIDEEIIKIYFFDLFVQYRKTFEPIINIRQANLPSAFENFVTLTDKWLNENT